MSEKLQFSVYLIKNEISESVYGKSTKPVPIDMVFITNFLKTKKYRPQNLKVKVCNGYNLYLFFNDNPSKIKWKDLISKIAEDNQDVLKNKHSFNESYILFFENILNKKIYAVSGGYGYTAFQSISENDYGIEIFSRLFKSEDKTIKSTKEKSLTGGMQGLVKFFRNENNLLENEEFGNFYQELNVELDKGLLTKTFGFSQKDIKSSCLCVVKNSFTIKKAISIEQLTSIITKCNALLINRKPINEDLNNISKVKKTETLLIENLKNILNANITKMISKIPCEMIIELCHKDFDKYLHADNFEVQLDNNKKITFDEKLNSLTQVIDKLNNGHTDVKNIINLLNKAYIRATNSDGDLNSGTYDLLKKHYCTEVIFNNRSYFLLNDEWFEIKPNFIAKLNSQCKDLVSKNTYTGNLEIWDVGSENAFNAKHISKHNTLVFDKVTPNNIEVCDILRWTDNEVYFIHVKEGFNNSMRDLCQQIYISVRAIAEDKKTGYELLKLLYQKLSQNQGESGYFIKARKQIENLNIDDFIKIFVNKKFIFVLAVLDSAITQRNLQDIEEFDSNIAKFSMVELSKNMMKFEIDLQICQIRNI